MLPMNHATRITLAIRCTCPENFTGELMMTSLKPEENGSQSISYKPPNWGLSLTTAGRSYDVGMICAPFFRSKIEVNGSELGPDPRFSFRNS